MGKHLKKGEKYMAIYHFRAKCGTSVISHLKYINREGKYKNRDDLVSTEVKNLPEGFKDITDFWEKALIFERKNANIYREYEISLPKELPNETNKKILNSFLEKEFGEKFLYNYAIHNPKGEQPHAHIMFCERELDNIKRDPPELFFKRYNPQNPEKGGAKKNRLMQKKEFLTEKRKSWENHLNKFLEAYGIDKVSCETLKKQRDEAIKQKDYVKAELLNREPASNLKQSSMKNMKFDEYEKFEFEKRKFENKLKQKIKFEQKKQKIYEDFKNEQKEKKEKTFKEILDEKEKLEIEIFKIHKKLDAKRLRENVYGILSNGEISKLKNEKRSLFKKIKNTKDKSEKQKLKYKVNQIDIQIKNIKLKFTEETILEKELEMRTKYMKALKFLNNKLFVIDKIFLEKLKDLDKNDFENQKYYEAYIDRKDLREDISDIKETINKNKKKIKLHYVFKKYDKMKNLKDYNSNLRKDLKTVVNISKQIQREQKLNEQNAKYGEFTLDDYRYTTYEAELENEL